jgi:hypothetical protein
MIWNRFCDIVQPFVVKKTSAFPVVQEVEFPPPLDGFKTVNVNMMPIRLDKSLLPTDLQRFWPLIAALHLPKDEEDNVMYLTVHECWVEPKITQRRPGLHVESPGLVKEANHSVSGGYWGNGYEIDLIPHGGIYFGSNVAGSCAIYPDDWIETGGVASGGDIEGMRSVLGRRVLMKKNEVWWACDKVLKDKLK